MTYAGRLKKIRLSTFKGFATPAVAQTDCFRLGGELFRIRELHRQEVRTWRYASLRSCLKNRSSWNFKKGMLQPTGHRIVEQPHPNEFANIRGNIFSVFFFILLSLYTQDAADTLFTKGTYDQTSG